MKLQDALLQIFEANSKKPEYRLWKHRYNKNILSIERQEEILVEHGYAKTKEAVWRLAKR